MASPERALLLAFAIANALLYSSLLPLWEGFDEPWHYGYVRHLSVSHSLPILGTTRLSEEVWESMLACPSSHVVKRSIPELQSFDSYFQLSAAERIQEREALGAIRTDGVIDSVHPNYEAQQPPLAYALLAGPDLLMSRLPIPRASCGSA